MLAPLRPLRTTLLSRLRFSCFRLLSRLLVMFPRSILYQFSKDAMYLTLQPTKYACPALVLQEISRDYLEDDVESLYRIDFDAPAKMLHVYDLDDWLVIPYHVLGPKHIYESFGHLGLDVNWRCILLQKAGDPLTLLKHKLLNTKHRLTHDELKQICTILGIPVGEAAMKCFCSDG